MYIPRLAARTLQTKASQYPIVAITGPRQAGKSTLAKHQFPDKAYCSLEDLDHREFAQTDPRGFLASYPNGAIFDEIQNVPVLFSYLQTLVDQKKQMGQFVLTGSQQFSLQANISQSLAGRVGFLQLLPFTLAELQQSHHAPTTLEALLFSGGYPPLYDRTIPPSTWYADYIMTYLERDVRQLKNVQDMHAFQRFIRMCAARTGQILNLSGLANDCGITHNTAKSWLSILETSYLVTLLQPHHRNFNKRLIKSPKLYFIDTGLCCTLLGIQAAEQLITHPMRGALFETWVVSELLKQRYNKGLLSNLYFWRDSQGHEVDVLMEHGENLIPLEVKAGQTITSDYFKGLQYWQQLSAQKILAWLIYAGESQQQRQQINVINWRMVDSLKNLDIT